MASKGLNAATRFTLAAGAAGVLGMMALATGNSKAVLGAIGAGAALGNAAGKRINGYRSSINGTIGKYSQVGRNALKGEKTKRKEQRQKYMQNQKERNYVEQYLQDKNGYIPSGKEINKEMEKRWDYQEAGITDRDIIDGARDLAEQKETDFLNDAGYTEEQRENYNDTEQKLYDNQEGMASQVKYRDAYEQLQNGDMTNEEFNKEFGEGEAEKARDHQIMEDKVQGKRERFESQALYAASIANSNSKSDFMDKKKMGNLRESNIQDYMQACKAQGKSCSREKAERIVDSAINDAARIKGIKSGANLPGAELQPKTQPESQPQPQTTQQEKPQSQPQQQTNDQRERRRGRRTRIDEERRNQRKSETQRRNESQRKREEEKRKLANDEHQENKQGEKNTNKTPRRVRDSKGRTSEVKRINTNQPKSGPTNTNANNGPIV